jgi:hypothetical protein
MVGATRPRLGGPGVFTQREGRRLEQENRRDIQQAGRDSGWRCFAGWRCCLDTFENTGGA